MNRIHTDVTALITTVIQISSAKIIGNPQIYDFHSNVITHEHHNPSHKTTHNITKIEIIGVHNAEYYKKPTAAPANYLSHFKMFFDFVWDVTHVIAAPLNNHGCRYSNTTNNCSNNY